MSEWTIVEKEFNCNKLKKFESVACQGNGYMGVRNSLEEKYTDSHPNTFINGVFNQPDGEVTELATLPDATNFEIFVNSERFSIGYDNTTEYERTLNLKTGETVRNVLWKTRDGVMVKINFRRIVSNVRKHILAQKITISTDKEIKLEIKAGIDGKITNSGVQHFGFAERRSYPGNTVGFHAVTTQSGVEVSVKSNVKSSREGKYWVDVDRRSIYACCSMTIGAGECVTFEKISAFATSRDLNCHKVDAAMYLEEAVALGYNNLFLENKEDWQKFWDDNRINIKSENEFYQQAINFSMYHLRIMDNRDDSRLGIGAKALSGEGYKGHSFWDTEIFIFPYFLYNDPDAARRLLEYRYSLLEKCREKADKYGYSGAMYPWESAWVDDGETCPYIGEPDVETGEQRVNKMGQIEVHVNADIAYAVWHYYAVTKDEDFMEKYGYEMVLEIAEFWLSRVEFVNGRYEILDVIGPDEYKDNVDNNAYTNYMVYFNLCFAEEILAKIKNEEYIKRLHNLSEVKEKLYLPKADEKGIIPQFDGFCDLERIDTAPYKNNEKVFAIFRDYSYEQIRKLQVSKQADNVMLFYTLPEYFEKQDIEKNFKYYEECTLHDSSLSMCIHSLVASRIGLSDMAERMFYDSCSVDLGDKNDNSDNGIHSASIGGIWLAVVMGFGGVRTDGNMLIAEPIIPDGIDEYSFGVTYRGSRIFFVVNKSGVTLSRVSGNSVEIMLNGEKKEI